MIRRRPPLTVDAADVAVLSSWAERCTANEAIRRRARIVLLAADGVAAAAIADQLGCSRQTVVTWRERYRQDGLTGLSDQPRSGRPAGVDPAAVIVATLRPVAEGLDRWTVRTLATDLGISSTAVADVWRAWGIAPEAGGVVLLTDPVLDEYVLDVVGMYVDAHLQAIAVATGTTVTGTVTVPEQRPVDGRPVLGGRLSRLDAGAPGCPAEFFDRVARRRGARVVTSEESGPGVEGRWPRDLLHVVRQPAQWQRVARVACLLAGATERGSASVAALGEALERHRSGSAFCWFSGGARNSAPKS